MTRAMGGGPQVGTKGRSQMHHPWLDFSKGTPPLASCPWPVVYPTSSISHTLKAGASADLPILVHLSSPVLSFLPLLAQLGPAAPPWG